MIYDVFQEGLCDRKPGIELTGPLVFRTSQLVHVHVEEHETVEDLAKKLEVPKQAVVKGHFLLFAEHQIGEDMNAPLQWIDVEGPVAEESGARTEGEKTGPCALDLLALYCFKRIVNAEETGISPSPS